MDSSGNRSSPVHRQTMKRIYRHSLFAMILLLSSSITMASDVERTKEGAAQLSAPARTNDQGTAKLEIVTGKPAVDRKKSRRSAKSKQRTKEFVRLGLLSAYESGRLHQSKFGATVFDPVSAGRAVDTGGYLNDPFLEKESSSKVIRIKPLDVYFGAFNPFLDDFFRPLIHGRFLLASDDMPLFGGIDGLETQPLYLTDGLFHNAEDSDTDHVVSSRTPFAYSFTMDKTTSVVTGLGWIPDLDDTRGTPISLADPGGDSTDKLSGVNLILEASYKAFTLTGGYVRALDSRSPGELALEGNEGDPIAWNSEITYSTELLRKESNLAVGYQRSSDALQYYLPEERYRTRASMALSDSTTFSLEYYLDKDSATRNGDEDGYGITTRIGVDF
jgi:hypothetical protein